MPSFISLINVISIIRLRRAQGAVVDAEAISLIRANETDEAAYRQAREASWLARERGDRNGARLYARVAMRIAAVTGRRIGPIEAGEQRYGEPTHEINGDRTRPKG